MGGNIQLPSLPSPHILTTKLLSPITIQSPIPSSGSSSGERTALTGGTSCAGEKKLNTELWSGKCIVSVEKDSLLRRERAHLKGQLERED